MKGEKIELADLRRVKREKNRLRMKRKGETENLNFISIRTRFGYDQGVLLYRSFNQLGAFTNQISKIIGQLQSLAYTACKTHEQQSSAPPPTQWHKVFTWVDLA